MVYLNPDFENPDFENPDFENTELHNPDFENPDFENPDFENPDFENFTCQRRARSGTRISKTPTSRILISRTRTSRILISRIPTSRIPDFENPDFENPDFENPDFENPDFENPDFENGSFQVSDTTWPVRNNGNTTSAYKTNVYVERSARPASSISWRSGRSSRARPRCAPRPSQHRCAVDRAERAARQHRGTERADQPVRSQLQRSEPRQRDVLARARRARPDHAARLL